MNNLVKISDPMSFVTAGKALFTVVNIKTGNRYTFKVSEPREQRNPDHPVSFVGVLTGPDNESDYTFLGMIFDGSRFVRSQKSAIPEGAPSAVAFSWVWSRLMDGNLPECVQVYHHGYCGRCGRTLTVPESIERGIGPECASKMAS